MSMVVSDKLLLEKPFAMDIKVKRSQIAFQFCYFLESEFLRIFLRQTLETLKNKSHKNNAYNLMKNSRITTSKYA